jgi:hypothetical protein
LTDDVATRFVYRGFMDGCRVIIGEIFGRGENVTEHSGADIGGSFL